MKFYVHFFIGKIIYFEITFYQSTYFWNLDLRGDFLFFQSNKINLRLKGKVQIN